MRSSSKKLEFNFDYNLYFIITLLIKALIILSWTSPYTYKIFEPTVNYLFNHNSTIEGIKISEYPFGFIVTLIQSICFKIDNFIYKLPFISPINEINHNVQFKHLFTGFVTLYFDYLIYKIIYRVTNSKLFSQFYWFAPFTIYLNYILGTFDVLPLYFLLLSYLYLQKLKPKQAGFFYGIAINAKLSMIIPLPLILIYLYRNNRFRNLLKNFISYFLLSAISLFLIGFYIIGFSAVKQPFGYANKLLALSIKFSESYQLFIIPILFTCLMYYLWNLRKTNWTILNTIISISFLTIALLSPSNITWFLWPLPFLIMNCSNSSISSFNLGKSLA